MQNEYIKPSRLVVALLVVLILILMLTKESFAKHYITIVDKDQTKTVLTVAKDPTQILENENIILSPFDNYVMTEFNPDNMAVLEIVRANKVTINVDNGSFIVFQSMKNVANAIEQANVTLNESDLISLPLNMPITDDTVINITRVTTRIVEVDEILQYEIIMQQTNTLKDGEFRILQSGVNGYNRNSTFQRMYDGEIVSEELLFEEYLEPVTEIRLIGDSDYITSRIMPETELELDENGNPIDYIEKYTGKATAYSALGKPTNLVPGDVAMNLGIVPRGSKVYVKTPDNSYVYGYGEVSDTGTALVENIILVDLFFESYLESCLFGAKEMEVYVLE